MASEQNSAIFNLDRWQAVEIDDDRGADPADCIPGQTGCPDQPFPVPPDQIPPKPPSDDCGCCGKGDQIVLMQKQNSEILTIMAVLLAMFIGLLYVMNENQS